MESKIGTITFLFTDVEGSTKMWEEAPDLMPRSIARHDEIALAVIAENGGRVVKSRGEGDSVFAVFPRASEAVAAAAKLQIALRNEPWPAKTPIKVRMALHTGEAQERDEDYYGAPVNRCARLRAIAHGGQIVVSLTTEELVRDSLKGDLGLKDLGLHRLKDLSRPEQVFQVLHPDLPEDFPPLRSLDALPNNLPQQLTSFIGREKVIAEVLEIFKQTRLLSLTGSGGAGKTRLALQVAADLLDDYEDGVWMVELAALADPNLVAQSIATTIGVREEPGRPILATLTDFLKPKKVLLVLDNCEHLLSACATLCDQLLRSCPGLYILATSREGLNIAGETTYRVPSLALPDPCSPQPISDLVQVEAVRLFVERAQAAQPSFQVNEQNAASLAQLCVRLDGIPLAIELAAARVKALSVDQINQRLDDRFRLLTGGSRTALPRQQTLRALIDWSYDLLSPQEQTLLRRLSVFAGGWTLEAAEAVCADSE